MYTVKVLKKGHIYGYGHRKTLETAKKSARTLWRNWPKTYDVLIEGKGREFHVDKNGKIVEM